MTARRGRVVLHNDLLALSAQSRVRRYRAMARPGRALSHRGTEGVTFLSAVTTDPAGPAACGAGAVPAQPSGSSGKLRLMAVHAHPDDESSKGAATMARYVREGVDVLVCTLTGGERGDILNKAMD